MDKEKAREEIARIIRRHTHHSSETIADAIIGAGYGNIEEALTEFAERLKANGKFYEARFFRNKIEVNKVIDETLKEMLKK